MYVWIATCEKGDEKFITHVSAQKDSCIDYVKFLLRDDYFIDEEEICDTLYHIRGHHKETGFMVSYWLEQERV